MLNRRIDFVMAFKLDLDIFDNTTYNVIKIFTPNISFIIDYKLQPYRNKFFGNNQMIAILNVL